MTHFIEEMYKDERKAYRNTMRDNLIAAGGRLYTNEYNGTVIAIKPIISGNNCKTFRVAIAYCNIKDKFKKSVGEAIALYRLNVNMCNVICYKYRNNTNDRMDEIVSNFTDMY